jgi:hypothetical protein
MTINPSDLSLVYSGSTSNNDPNLSLGGESSSFRVSSDVINNLFDDVQPDESLEGHEDYRCLYMFNDSDETAYNITIWIADAEDAGSTVEVGINGTDEFQRLIVTGGTVTGGSLRLSFSGVEFNSIYNSDLAVWATALQTSLRAIEVDGVSLLSDVTVTAQNSGGGTTIFDIGFGGRDGKRSQPQILVINNDLEPLGTIETAIAVLQGGSPVNTLAPEIEVEGNQPPDVGFFVPTEISPITIPRLDPADGFPIWFKRVTPAGTLALANDFITLRIRVTSFGS